MFFLEFIYPENSCLQVNYNYEFNSKRNVRYCEIKKELVPST
jgi:hypothetical protein